MLDQNFIQELVDIADQLDSNGLSKQARQMDNLIEKLAQTAPAQTPGAPGAPNPQQNAAQSQLNSAKTQLMNAQKQQADATNTQATALTDQAKKMIDNANKQKTQAMQLKNAPAVPGAPVK